MEALAISYHEGADGLLYPDIKMEEQESVTLGKFGIMALEYMQAEYPQRLRSLRRFNLLNQKLKEVEEEANQLMEKLTGDYLRKHKPANPESTMEQYQIHMQARMQAEETVRHQIVNRFH